MNKGVVAVSIGVILAGSLLGCIKHTECDQTMSESKQEEIYDILGISEMESHYDRELRANGIVKNADGAVVNFSGTDKGVSYGFSDPESMKRRDLIQAISGGRLGRFDPTALEEIEDSDVEYMEIIPINLDGYEDWTPSKEQLEYSVDSISQYLRYSDIENKQVTNASAEKVFKNDSGEFNYPESAVVNIEVEFDTNEGMKYQQGTGVLINKDTILTCAHTLYLDGEVMVPMFVKHTYLYKGNITRIQVQADIDRPLGVVPVPKNLFAYADKIYVSSNYIDAIDIMEKAIQMESYDINYDDEDTMRRMFENDFAIIKLKQTEGEERYLGEDVGWIGILPYETTGNQKWGTLYGYPEIVPKLPSLEDLIECLKIDAKCDDKDYDSATKGISIQLVDVINAIKDEDSRKHYKSLFKRNGVEMYSSYEKLDSTSEFRKLLRYKISTYSGQSGAPIIQSVYNSRLNKYFDYTSGIHCGYVVEEKEMEESGDLYMYVYDYLNRRINFKDEYDPNIPKVNSWTVGFKTCGYNYGRQIDKALYNYLLANEFYPGYAYIPEDRKG